MSEPNIKDLMLPLYQCAVVSEDATLHNLVVVLEATRKMYQRWDYRPRLALVQDQERMIVGTVRQYDILRTLEPKYREFGILKTPGASELTKEFVKSTYQTYQVWSESLLDLCRRASQLKVRDIMRIPGETEYVDKEASLGEAVHAMLLGNHPSLLVTDSSGVVGILRLSDIGGLVVRELKKWAEAPEGE